MGVTKDISSWTLSRAHLIAFLMFFPWIFSWNQTHKKPVVLIHENGMKYI